MSTNTLAALPPLRLAVRPLGDAALDADLVLAEAGALLAWAAALGRPATPWLVVDGTQAGVAIEVADDLTLPAGLAERRVPAGRYATQRRERATASELRAAAHELLVRAKEPQVATALESLLCGRLDDGGGLVAHVALRDPRTEA